MVLVLMEKSLVMVLVLMERSPPFFFLSSNCVIGHNCLQSLAIPQVGILGSIEDLM